MLRVAVYALTARGLDLAARLAPPFQADIYAASGLASGGGLALAGFAPVTFFSSLPELVAATFRRYDCHIFITAAGIAVRCIAPHLKHKAVDPAVLVVDHHGQYVISLLSGHLGGANELARRAAAVLGGRAVITTATDCDDLPALDVLAKERGLAVADLAAVKSVSAALLAGEAVELYDPDNLLGISGSRWEGLFTAIHEAEPGSPEGENGGEGENEACGASSAPAGPPRILVTGRNPAALGRAAERCLVLHPPLYCAGVGCKRGAPANAVYRAVADLFAELGLSSLSLAFVASIDAKSDEPGLLEAAHMLHVPLKFYSAGELSAFPVTQPSTKVRERFGIDGVCEPAALAAAGRGAELVAAKTRFEGVTVALARRDAALLQQ